MINCLTNEYLPSENKEAKLTPEKYITACNLVASDIEKILKEKNIDVEDVLMVGVARGGLPLMVGVSHRTGIRNCTSVQIKMNKSDNKNDYGKAHILNGQVDKNKKYYFVFEDIIYKGQSVNLLMDTLGVDAEKVLGIYTLVVDDNFEATHVFNYDLNLIKTCYKLHQDHWTYFYWEKGYKVWK